MKPVQKEFERRRASKDKKPYKAVGIRHHSSPQISELPFNKLAAYCLQRSVYSGHIEEW